MSDAYRVDVRSVDGGPTALGWGGSLTVVIDRPVEGGGRGLGFNGGQLLNIAVAGCVSNDLFREAAKRGIRLDRVRVVADSDYTGSPATSTPIEYEVELSGDASAEELADLLAYVDRIAEIPNSLRRGTEVRLRGPSGDQAARAEVTT
jgi:organic hydroperoxide reductase OsmC/OhrA